MINLGLLTHICILNTYTLKHLHICILHIYILKLTNVFVNLPCYSLVTNNVEFVSAQSNGLFAFATLYGLSYTCHRFLFWNSG